MTLLRDVMTTEDLIWATTSPGSGLMDMTGGTLLTYLGDSVCSLDGMNSMGGSIFQ